MSWNVSSDRLHFLSSGSLVALILLCVAWELWLAPVRPGGSWVALKAVPLLAPLPGILRGRLYTFSWSPLLILAYFVEGAVRGYADAGISGQLAKLEIFLSLLFFFSALAYVRASRKGKKQSPAAENPQNQANHQ